MVVCLLVTSDLCFVFSVSDNNSVVVEGPKVVHKAARYADDGQEASDRKERRQQDQPIQSKQCMYFILPIGLEWQSLSLDYRFVMLISVNHYMLIEFVWYLHYNKWLGSQYNAFKDPLLCLQTKITGLYSYIVSHCIVLYDVNITIWILDRILDRSMTWISR